MTPRTEEAEVTSVSVTRLADAAADPVRVVDGGGGNGHHEIDVGGEARHREIALDTAAHVEHLRVDDAAGPRRRRWRNRRCSAVVASGPLSRNLASEDWSKSPTASRTARCSAPRTETSSGPVRVGIARLDAVGREPVRALPSRDDAEDGAAGSQAIVQRRAAHAARRLGLTEGPVHRVEQSHHLRGALVQVAGVAWKA